MAAEDPVEPAASATTPEPRAAATPEPAPEPAGEAAAEPAAEPATKAPRRRRKAVSPVTTL